LAWRAAKCRAELIPLYGALPDMGAHHGKSQRD